MKSILERLYNGEIIPIEQYRPMFEKQRARYLKEEEVFTEKLEESLQKEFEALMDDHLSIFAWSFNYMIYYHVACKSIYLAQF